MSISFGFISLGSFLSFAAEGAAADESPMDRQREMMISEQIEARGIRDPRILAAMRRVKRHLFVPEDMAAFAYDDNALPIEKNQTISQPYIVALMTQLAAVKPQDKVLEIGTGSGYQAAVLAELCQKVITIEIIPELAEDAAKRLKKLGYGNVTVHPGDGYLGWSPEAPYDAILITAAPKTVPEELLKQLKPGGRLVVPLGDLFQDLYVYTKDERGKISHERILGVRFVPMVKGAKGAE